VIGPVIGAVLATVTYDAIARPRAFEAAQPAQGTLGDIEGRRDLAAEPAAEPGRQGTGGDIPGRRQ
jgi:hypothetical protein